MDAPTRVACGRRTQRLPPPDPLARMGEATVYRTRREQEVAVFAPNRAVPVDTPEGLFATGWQARGVSARSREIPRPLGNE